MNADADGFDEESPEVFDFLDEYLSDREAGKEYPLSHYLARFPGHEEAISREFLHRRDLERGKPELPRVDPEGVEPRIGPYQLLSELGRGGQGIVYLAEDTRIERKVALKLLPPAALLVSEDRKARMRREAEVVSRLDHPGICGIYDAEISGEVAYIAMPFVEGRTLGAAIAEAREGRGEAGGGLPLAPTDQAELFELLAFFEDAARALHAAHEAGIVHRDIKPGNLMITPTGEPVWLDFGQARDTESTAMQLTVSGELFGTPAYMSPEQIHGGSDKVDPRIDVWALAVSLFEALTLERPFEGASNEALLFNVQTAEPRRARELNPTVTDELEVVLQTGLEKDLPRRYASALAFAEELARIQRFEPIHARPASAALHFRRWTKRHPVLFVSIAGALLALTAGLIVTLYLLAREREALDFAVGRHLAERAVALIDEEPAVSLALGIEAVERAPTYRTRSALYEALDGCYLIHELDGDPAFRFRDLEVVDGSIAAAALQDGTGRLYDVVTGEEVARWKAHEGDAVVVSVDRVRVATGGVDGRVCVFDRESGEVACTFDGPGGEITDLRLMHSTIAVRGSEGPPRVYRTETGEDLGPLPGASEIGGRIRSTPVGFTFFEVPVLGAQLERLRGWAGDEGALEESVLPVETGVRVCAVDRTEFSTIWAGDDRRLYFVDSGGRPHFAPPPIDLGGTGELIVMSGSAASAAVAFAVVREGGSVRGVLADFEAGELRVLCPPGAEPIVDAAFERGGGQLATVRQDGVVRIWDVEEAREIASFKFQLLPVELLWASGNLLVTQSNGPTAQVWYGSHRPDLYTLLAGGAVRVVLFAPDGERALSLADEGGARLWMTPTAKGEGIVTGKRIAALPSDGAPFLGGAFDETGGRVLLWGSGGVVLWRPDADEAEQLAPGDGRVVEAAFQPVGTRILVSGEQSGARTIDVTGGGATVDYGASGASLRAEFSCDGRFVATSDEAGTLRLFETETGSLLWERAHGNEEEAEVRIVDLAFEPGGREVAVARDDRQVHFFDLVSGERSAHRFPYGPPEDPKTREYMKVFPPRSLSWSPDGRRILVTGAHGRGAFDVRELATKKKMLIEVYHEDDLTSGSFSPDGSLVLSSSKDGTILVRDVTTGTPVVHLRGKGGAACCAAFSGGEGPLRVIAGFEDGTVQVWPVDPLPWARARRPRELLASEVERETRLARPLEYP